MIVTTNTFSFEDRIASYERLGDTLGLGVGTPTNREQRARAAEATRRQWRSPGILQPRDDRGLRN